MADPGALETIERAIANAIAPAFLLSASMTALNVLTMRRNRLVDRILSLAPDAPGMHLLTRRARLSQWAIVANVTAALLVCLLVLSAILGTVLSWPIETLVVGFTVAAMVAFAVALACFLGEVVGADHDLDLRAPPK